MWRIVAIAVVIFIVWYFFIQKKVEKMTDENKINTIVEKVRQVKPELVPIDTVSVDDNKARMLFVNTKNYAGEMYDSTIKEDGSVDVQMTTQRKAGVQDKENMEKL